MEDIVLYDGVKADEMVDMAREKKKEDPYLGFSPYKKVLVIWREKSEWHVVKMVNEHRQIVTEDQEGRLYLFDLETEVSPGDFKTGPLDFPRIIRV